MRAPKDLRAVAITCLVVAGCVAEKPPEPSERSTSAATPSAQNPTRETASTSTPEEAARRRAEQIERHKQAARERQAKRLAPKPVMAVRPTPGDPARGEFTMADAVKGMPAKGLLVADIATEKGKLECELYPDKAPITVANFVGLARGIRPWKKDDVWVKERLYDNNVFHRITGGFMIQGGDPEKTGLGSPGFEVPDEIWEGARHDAVGLLCMANRGPNTNGSQFFIMDGPAPHLDGGYTVFGKCAPENVIHALAKTRLTGPNADKPPVIRSIRIRRDATRPARPEGLGSAAAPQPSTTPEPSSQPTPQTANTGSP